MTALHDRPIASARRNRRSRSTTGHDPILEDLRSFAKDLGIAGCAAMGREELVESLRQRYLLESMLKRAPNHRSQ